MTGVVRGSEVREWSQSTEEVAQRAGALEPTHHTSHITHRSWISEDGFIVSHDHLHADGHDDDRVWQAPSTKSSRRVAHTTRGRTPRRCVCGIHQWYGRLSKVGHARRHHTVHHRRDHCHAGCIFPCEGGGWWWVMVRVRVGVAMVIAFRGSG